MAHQAGLDPCCGHVIEAAVDRVMDDLSDGMADPEFKAFVSLEVWAALVEHLESGDQQLVHAIRAIEDPEVHQLHLVD